MRDEDDWVGTPPEGHHSRDRAKPDFWRSQWRHAVTLGAGLLMAIILVLALVLLVR